MCLGWGWGMEINESKEKMTKHPGFGRRGSGAAPGVQSLKLNTQTLPHQSILSIIDRLCHVDENPLGAQVNREKTSLLRQLKSANSPKKDSFWSDLSWEEHNVTGFVEKSLPPTRGTWSGEDSVLEDRWVTM